MPKIICNTSPLQYLHQLDQLSLLKSLAGRITVPTAVENEITIGIEWGVDLPDLRKLDWLDFQTPLSSTAAPLVRDLGPGETEVMMLAMESSDCVVILDDALARKTAELLGIKVTGTLGVLLDAKRAGLIDDLTSVINHLEKLNFLSCPHTRKAVIRLAGEL